MVHFHVIRNVESEGIFNDVPPYCSCVQSSSSCTGMNSTIKKWKFLLLENSYRRNIIILSKQSRHAAPEFFKQNLDQINPVKPVVGPKHG